MRNDLSFDNTFVRTLPGDPLDGRQRRQVLGACYSRVAPTPVPQPQLLAHSREVAELLDLGAHEHESQAFAEVLAGNRVLPGMQPYAACYGGHQFGNWAGQLGDGRAITLGEHVNAKGQRFELQLKGAGPTPYSRTADGRAVVRSSVREFLCSEAMHHLGVPTTRALSLVATGEPVLRDMFYDGHARHEPGAVVCRVAPSFVRFGNFEIFAARKDLETLKKLADYMIATHFPELLTSSASDQPNHGPGDIYVRWFEEVCRRTAEMVTHWMRVGFVHGVMNTDNMSVLGLTIDYGPYGWLEDYDLNWTPNTTDAQGRRYRYGHQPRIAWWNLGCFASALVPLVGNAEPFQDALEHGARALEEKLQRMMAIKLGLRDESFMDRDPLVDALPPLLQRCQLDYTIFFRKLADVQRAEEADALLTASSYLASSLPGSLPAEASTAFAQWLADYLKRIADEGKTHDERRAQMNAVNPKYVLRNYMAQLAIDKAEQGDGSMVRELLDVLRKPYEDQPEHEAFFARRPEWARHRAGCSMLSCSS